jgi:hypothetical protein
METIRYADDVAVTYLTEGDRVLLETLKYGLGITIREAHAMLERIITDSLDPIDADGEEFEFDDYLAVPGPRDRVSLIKAREECGRHIAMCQRMLEGPDPFGVMADHVSGNSEHWLRFWSVRAPTAELRDAFGESLEKLLEMRRMGGRLLETMEDGDGPTPQ